MLFWGTQIHWFLLTYASVFQTVLYLNECLISCFDSLHGKAEDWVKTIPSFIYSPVPSSIYLFKYLFIEWTLFEIYHLSEMAPGSVSWYQDSNYPSFHLYDPARGCPHTICRYMVLVVLVITSMHLSFSHQSLTSWVQRWINWIIWCWVEKAGVSMVTTQCGMCEDRAESRCVWEHR